MGIARMNIGRLSVEMIQTSHVPAIAAAVNASGDPNAHEILIVLKTPRSAAFLAGDLSGPECTEVLAASFLPIPCRLSERYYKVSHHGSRTGYDGAFFASYASTYSIVSCSQSNRYNHPHNPPVPGQLPANHEITWRDGQRVYTHGIL
jgi:beta-lactamase superfamily II metal-dependent hydrolase